MEDKTIEEIVQERATIDELRTKLEKMEEDKASKCDAAIEQLVDMLAVTVDKYLTVTGTAEELRVIRFITGDSSSLPLLTELELATSLAIDLAEDAENMRKKALSLPYDEMDKLCEGFYKEKFAVNAQSQEEAIYNMAHEMMRVDLCRNVGGAAEDMVSFRKRVDEEIEATRNALDELENEEE